MRLTHLLVLVACYLPAALAAPEPPIRHIPLDYGLKLNVSIGTPPQPLRVLFNTGSAGTWVLAKKCRAQSLLAFRLPSDRFNSSASSSWQADEQRTWSLAYGIGARYSGSLGRDLVQVGEGIEIRGQLLGVAAKADGIMVRTFDFGGVLGVGDQQRPTLDAHDPIEMMYGQRLIPRKMFALHLDQLNERQHYNGTLIVGGVGSGYFSGELHFVPIRSRWEVVLDHIRVQRESPPGPAYGVRAAAILDSASNVLVGPYREVLAIKDHFQVGRLDPATNLYQFVSCHQAHASSALLSISIGGRKFELTARDLVIKLSLRGENLCFLALRAVQNSPDYPHKYDVWSLGTPFLKRYHTVYDYTHGGRVGFADAIVPEPVNPLIS